MVVAKVTSKGQITIPKDIRRALGLETGSRVLFALEGDKAVMEPAGQRPLTSLRGVFSADKPYNNYQEIREAAGRERGQALLEEAAGE